MVSLNSLHVAILLLTNVKQTNKYNMRKFIPGDRVICISKESGFDIYVGNIYIVKQVFYDKKKPTLHLRNLNFTHSYYTARFKLAYPELNKNIKIL
jgi:hypothetical protein